MSLSISQEVVRARIHAEEPDKLVSDDMFCLSVSCLKPFCLFPIRNNVSLLLATHNELYMSSPFGDYHILYCIIKMCFQRQNTSSSLEGVLESNTIFVLCQIYSVRKVNQSVVGNSNKLDCLAVKYYRVNLYWLGIQPLSSSDCNHTGVLV